MSDAGCGPGYRPTAAAPKPVPTPTPKHAVSKASARPSTQLTPKGWAKVVAPGDSHYGQVGRIIEICDDDADDGLDVIVRFPGDGDNYAFGSDELASTQRRAGPTAPRQ